MTATSTKQAEQCRKAADALQKDIDRKHDSARSMRAMPPTRKRIQDSQGIFNDAIRLEKYQSLLRLLAEQHDTGCIQDEVKHVTSRAALEREVYSNPKLRLMFDCHERMETPTEANERMEKQFLLSGIPGFFPTPAAVADELIALIGGISPGEHILEPGAGTGSLIDAARRHQPEVNVHYFERNYSLSDFLETKYKGHDAIYSPGRDFTDFQLEHYAPRYTVVLMNPPFENGQDAEHVQRAYELLAPGGRLGAIVGAGILCRSDKNATRFREFMNENDAHIKDLPAGSFKTSGTGTNCSMIRIQKPY